MPLAHSSKAVDIRHGCQSVTSLRDRSECFSPRQKKQLVQCLSVRWKSRAEYCKILMLFLCAINGRWDDLWKTKFNGCIYYRSRKCANKQCQYKYCRSELRVLVAVVWNWKVYSWMLLRQSSESLITSNKEWRTVVQRMEGQNQWHLTWLLFFLKRLGLPP